MDETRVIQARHPARSLLATIEPLVAAGYVVVIVSTPDVGDRPHAASITRCGSIEVDSVRHEASCRGTNIDLTELEFGLLRQLTTEPGRAWTYQELSEVVWEVPYFGDAAPLRTTVKRLRRKLSSANAGVELQAVRGFGFRLVSLPESIAQAL